MDGKALAEFAMTIRAAAHEEAAQLCETLQRAKNARADSMNQAPVTAAECAAAIRALAGGVK